MAATHGQLTAKIEKNTLIITVPLNSKPVPSKSGKTLVVCSTYGNVTLPDVVVNGKPVTLGLNAYIKAD
jgi:hypothetical protein